MSITIKSFAGGLSGKIQNGDIVSIYVTEKDKASSVPPELKYVRVITTTTSGGVDENEVVPNEDGSFDLPTTMTVLVTVKQAELLADYEKNATMHVALVYRGNDETAEKFIKTQDILLLDAAPPLRYDGACVILSVMVNLLAFRTLGDGPAPCALAASGIAVANIQPQRTVLPQNTPPD